MISSSAPCGSILFIKRLQLTRKVKLGFLHNSTTCVSFHRFCADKVLDDPRLHVSAHLRVHCTATAWLLSTLCTSGLSTKRLVMRFYLHTTLNVLPPFPDSWILLQRDTRCRTTECCQLMGCINTFLSSVSILMLLIHHHFATIHFDYPPIRCWALVDVSIIAYPSHQS